MSVSRYLRRSKRPEHQRPAWVKWMLVLFLLYIIAQGVFKGPEGTPRTPVQQALDDTGKNLSPENMFKFSEYKNRIFPEYGATLRISDVQEGKGPMAVCGQTARIAYKALRANNQPLDDQATRDKPLTLQLGAGKAMPVFDQGIVGMRVGGKRNLQSPLGMSYGVEGFKRTDILSNEAIRFEVELLSVEPHLSQADLQPYRIAEVQNGYGPPLNCGHPAHVALIIWDVTGKKLYTTPGVVSPDMDKPAETATLPAPGVKPDAKPEGIRFTPGKSEVFFGLEQGVIGMSPGSVRTLIVPPAFQKTLSGKPPSIDFPLPANQTVLVDVEYLP